MPPDDVAIKLVQSVPGVTGLAIRTIYGTGGRLNDVLKMPEFVGLRDVTIQRALARACKKFKIKRSYTINSIRFAGGRKIALTMGFLAAHNSLKSGSVKRTEKILGKKVIANLTR